jgi:hypothetical protein
MFDKVGNKMFKFCLFKEEKLKSIISYLIIPHQLLTLTKANDEEAPTGYS